MIKIKFINSNVKRVKKSTGGCSRCGTSKKKLTTDTYSNIVEILYPSENSKRLYSVGAISDVTDEQYQYLETLTNEDGHKLIEVL